MNISDSEIGNNSDFPGNFEKLSSYCRDDCINICFGDFNTRLGSLLNDRDPRGNFIEHPHANILLDFCRVNKFSNLSILFSQFCPTFIGRGSRVASSNIDFALINENFSHIVSTYDVITSEFGLDHLGIKMTLDFSFKCTDNSLCRFQNYKCRLPVHLKSLSDIQETPQISDGLEQCITHLEDD